MHARFARVAGGHVCSVAVPLAVGQLVVEPLAVELLAVELLAGLLVVVLVGLPEPFA